MSRFTIIPILAIGAALGLAGVAATPASAAPPPLAPTTVTTAQTIDLDLFAGAIASRLDGHVVGYGYAIARNGTVLRSGANGLRRLAQDGGELPFTPDTMAQAASTTKTVTAAALVKALVARGLSVDTRIDRYLPRCWRKGPNVRGLTFRDLLGHHSLLAAGAGCKADPLKCILDVIAKGRPARRTNGSLPYAYSNTVYGLMRVLVPFVRARAQMQAAFGWSKHYCRSHTGELNELVSGRFRDYVLDDLLGPLGVSASFYPQGDGVEDYAFSYSNADRTEPGAAPREDFHLRAGAGYLAISANAFARLLSALDAGLIVPKALADEMKGVPGNRMGFDTSITGDLGEYVWKNGGCPGAAGTQRGCSALAVVFPNGMQVYVTINSGGNTYQAQHGGLDDVVRDAFDAALL